MTNEDAAALSERKMEIVFCASLLNRSDSGGLDFVPIGVFPTAPKAHTFARAFKAELHKREKKRT